jgi:putative aldouronate transport system permease protein
MGTTKPKNFIKDSPAYRIFTLFAYAVILIWVAACIFPFVHMIAISMSSRDYADAMLVGLWPRGFTLSNYGQAFTDAQILSSLSMSLKRTVLGVLVELVVTILAAYPLSKDKREFPGRGFFAMIFIFCMIFHGGLVPTFILVSSQLNLANSVFALILPNAVNIGNLILLMNFFRQIPKEIEEAAQIDGENYFGLLGRIILPLSINAILTLVLFISIGHWNSWFDGMIYMKEVSKYPLSTYLYIVRDRLNRVQTQEEARIVLSFSQQGMIMTYAVICTLPVMVLYPMLQKYVKKGLIIGSVKG